MNEKLKLPDVTVVKLKAKVANLKTQYIKTKDWRGKTGQGVRETEGPQSFHSKYRST
jgi:hypothetical protein